MKSDKLITTAEDLLTSRDETRAGFIAMALEKIIWPQNMFLKQEHSKPSRNLPASQRPFNIAGYSKGLAFCIRLSDKSLKHLNEADKRTAVVGLIETFLEPAGEGFLMNLFTDIC